MFDLKELMKPRTAAFYEKIREENYADLLAKAIVKVKKMKEEEEKLKRKQSLDEEEEDEEEEGGRNYNRDHSLCTNAGFSEKLTFTLIPSRTYGYQWVRNVSFSENFAYLLNE